METLANTVKKSASDIQVAIGTKVLIVEDEAVVALHLRRELSGIGYVVTGVATAGAQALKMID